TTRVAGKTGTDIVGRVAANCQPEVSGRFPSHRVIPHHESRITWYERRISIVRTGDHDRVCPVSTQPVALHAPLRAIVLSMDRMRGGSGERPALDWAARVQRLEAEVDGLRRAMRSRA